jgi:hypothetical protein
LAPIEADLPLDEVGFWAELPTGNLNEIETTKAGCGIH